MALMSCRSVWGSLVLLRHVDGGKTVVAIRPDEIEALIPHSWLAYTASIVTIVSLLFSTFTQQVITIK